MLIRLTPVPLMLEGLALRATTLPKLSKLAVRVAYKVMVWEERRTTRRALAWLDHDHLDDIGIDPLRAAHEADKPFWRP